MKKHEKKMLWWRGAKFCLMALKRTGGDPKEEAATMLEIKGMKKCLSDDYWARGFVAMLKRQAEQVDFHFKQEDKNVSR